MSNMKRTSILGYSAIVAMSFNCWSANYLCAETPPYANHQDLSYYQSADGSRTPVRTIDDWRQRRAHIIAGIEAAMGDCPRPVSPVPLEITVLSESREDGFVRRKIAYHTDRADTCVHAWLMIPHPLPAGKHAAVLCLHQTIAEGKDSPAGLADRPSMHYALELTHRGFITLSPDYPSLGEYQYDFTDDRYQSGSMKAIYDNIRAIDVLQSLPEVDPERIGCIGHSLGGHNGLFTAVFDMRIKAIVTCCGFTSFQNDDMPSWSGPRYMPQVSTTFGNDPRRMPFDFAEVLAAIAPRPILIVAAVHDHDFAVEGVRKTVSAAQVIYGLFKSSNALSARYPKSEHDFPIEEREAAYSFLNRSLGSTNKPRQ